MLSSISAREWRPTEDKHAAISDGFYLGASMGHSRELPFTLALARMQCKCRVMQRRTLDSLRQIQALVLAINTVNLELGQCFLLFPSPKEPSISQDDPPFHQDTPWLTPRVVQSGSLETELPLLGHEWEPSGGWSFFQ